MPADVYFTLSLVLSDCILIALSLFEKSFVDFSIWALAIFFCFAHFICRTINLYFFQLMSALCVCC